MNTTLVYLGVAFLIIGIIMIIGAVIWNKTSSTNGTTHTLTTSMIVVLGIGSILFIVGICMIIAGVMMNKHGVPIIHEQIGQKIPVITTRPMSSPYLRQLSNQQLKSECEVLSPKAILYNSAVDDRIKSICRDEYRNIVRNSDKYTSQINEVNRELETSDPDLKIKIPATSDQTPLSVAELVSYCKSLPPEQLKRAVETMPNSYYYCRDLVPE